MAELMTYADILGWMAVLFTLTAFSMRTMLPLRAAAIGANIGFIGFGYLEGTLPILTLHAILLPCNIMRLWQIISAKRAVVHTEKCDPRANLCPTCPLAVNISAYNNQKQAVATVDRVPAEIDQGVSAGQHAEHGSREVAGLRAEIAALRKQLQKSPSDLTVARSLKSAEITILNSGDIPLSCGNLPNVRNESGKTSVS